MTRRVTVVGVGVVGLTVAHEFADHGDQVTVVADVDTHQTVSAVAAALWFPFRSGISAQANTLLRQSLARFTSLAHLNESGVAMRTGVVMERAQSPDRSWASHLAGTEEVVHSLLPPGVRSGVRATLPFIDIPDYLPWLRGQLRDRGVRFVRRTVHELESLRAEADVAVLATGLRGGELTRDYTVTPVRGQIVRLQNPGLTEWVTDEANPSGLTYVFPRRNDVVVGGTADEGSRDERTHLEVESAMLARAAQLVPQLRGQQILGRAAGLRPSRREIRVERILDAPLPTFAAYGHGGAGVTLSWGTAELVHRMSLNV